MQTPELNVATVSIDTIISKDAKINDLQNKIADIKAETSAQRALAALQVEHAKQDSKVVTIRTIDRWGDEEVVGVRNLDSVTELLRKDAEKQFGSKITKLETQIEEKEKQLKQYREDVKELELKYNRQLVAIKDENTVAERARNLVTETEKVRLAEEHAKKLESFKETKKNLDARIAELQDEVQKLKDRNTNEDLEKTIREEMAKAIKEIETLKTENRALRSTKSFKIMGLVILTKIFGESSWFNGKLNSAINRKYRGW